MFRHSALNRLISHEAPRGLEVHLFIFLAIRKEKMCGKWIGTAVSLIFIGKREKPNGNGGVWQGDLLAGR